MFPLPLNTFFEAAALLTSVVCWRNIKSNKFRWFLPFLFFIVIAELAGRYVRRQLHIETNGYIFNFSIPIEYLFYAVLFLNSYQTESFKRLARYFVYAFLVFCLVVYLVNGIYWFNSILLVVGNMSAILFSCLYFYELLITEERINLLREPLFWISTGILLFNLGEFLYSAFYKLLHQPGWDNGTKLFKAINNNLILVLYLCIIIGLLCVKTSRDYRATSGQ